MRYPLGHAGGREGPRTLDVPGWRWELRIGVGGVWRADEAAPSGGGHSISEANYGCELGAGVSEAGLADSSADDVSEVKAGAVIQAAFGLARGRLGGQ